METKKYFVVEVTRTEGSESCATAVHVKDTIDEASMLYHQIMASIYANDAVVYGLCQIINSDGGIEVMERYPVLSEDE